MTLQLGRRFAEDLPFDDTEIIKLAKLLDEPHDVVKTLNSRLLSKDNGSLVSSISYPNHAFYQIGVCEACLKQGVHLVFAEVPWLNRCPVHRVTYCVQSYHWRPAITRFDNYVDAITGLLRSTNEKWPSPPQLGTDENCGGDEYFNLTSFIGWLKQAHSTKKWIERHQIWINGLPAPTTRGEWLTLPKLLSLCPAPPCVQDVLPDSTDRLCLRVSAYGARVARAWKRLEKRARLDDVIYYYKRVAGLGNAQLLVQKLLQRCLESIQASHTVCKCGWGWSKYLGWQEVDPLGWPHWGYICPYTVAANELISEWGNFPKVLSVQDTKREFITIEKVARNCSGLAFTSLPTQPDEGGYTIPSTARLWFLPRHLEDVLSRVIVTEVHVRIEELRKWLVALEQGTRPHIRSTVSGDVMLLSVNRKMILFSWRSMRNG